MRHVEPEVFLIAKSQLEIGATQQWMNEKNVSKEGQARLVTQDKTDAEMIVELAGRRCYMSFEVGLNPNVNKIREDVVEYIDNILKVGHGSVIEHVTFTFAIENVSRVFTGEMNRHRAGCAISEGSMRYIRFDDIPYWIPTSIQGGECRPYEGEELLAWMRDNGGAGKMTLSQKRVVSQAIFREAFNHTEGLYAELMDVWKEELAPDSKFQAKKEITSMMRRIVPMGVATGGVWTLNLRALRHVFDMRCSEAAEEEILLVATKMLNLMRHAEPSLFGDFVTNDNGISTSKYRKV